MNMNKERINNKTMIFIIKKTKMKTNKEKTIKKLTSKVLNETLESKVKNLEERLGGMEDEHPRFGNKKLPIRMTKDEIDAMFNEPISSDDDEEIEFDDEDENDNLNEIGQMPYFPSHDEEEEEEEEIEVKTKFNPLGSPKSEFDEGFDSLEVKRYRKGKDYEEDDEFEEIPLGMTDHSNLEDDSTTPGKYIHNQIMNYKRRFDLDDESEEMYEGKNMCEQCGSEMKEGKNMCEQCGSNMSEGIYDVNDLDDSNKFDYVQEEDSMDMETEENDESCKYHMKNYGPNDERTIKFCKGINESLKGKQKMLDKNKNGRLDAADFKMLRAMKGKKSETKEGKKFPDLSGDGKVTRKDILMGRGVKLGKKKQVKKNKEKSKVKESVQLSEDELISLIETVVLEQKKTENNIKSMGKPKGLTKYEQVHSKDKKQNDEYLKSVGKKMKDYLKDGSKGSYETNPDIFPKGNGELTKMSKKAYVPSSAVQDYTDNFTAAALENLDYDSIEPNEEWVTSNIEGSSKTGNNPEWANTGKSDVNKKRNEIRKKNMLGKLKRKAYNKSPQPVVTDKTGEDEGDKIMTKLESIEPKEKKKINEEFGRMKELLSYNRKTQ